MFEPELLGLSATALRGMAATLVIPVLGFAFLYLLELPLDGLPIGSSATPPKWVLPVFAHGGVALLGLLGGCLVALHATPGTALGKQVQSELMLVRELGRSGSESTPSEKLKKATIDVASYGGHGHFSIFTNGYHVFSSHRNCVAAFQCKDTENTVANSLFREFGRAKKAGGGLFLLEHNALPITIPIEHLLAAGENVLDVVVGVSGTGGCTLDVTFSLQRGSNDVKPFTIRTLPHPGTGPGVSRSALKDREDLASGPGEAGQIMPYRLPRRERGTVCERVRIVAHLAAESFADDHARLIEDRLGRIQRDWVCGTLGAATSELRECDGYSHPSPER